MRIVSPLPPLPNTCERRIPEPFRDNSYVNLRLSKIFCFADLLFMIKVHTHIRFKYHVWISINFRLLSYVYQKVFNNRQLWVKSGFPDSSVGKESTCNAGDPSLIPGLGRSAGEGTGYPLQYSHASLVAQLVKNPPAVRETSVRSLGWEDPLEKGMATHSSILA